MFHVLQVVTVMLVAVALAMSLAHALELPGKVRLGKDAYVAVQSIYYPGFTIGGGAGEVGGLLASIFLLLFTPRGKAFWWTLVAVLGLVGMQVVYWLVTHPVNQFWVEGQSLDKFSSGFFSFGTKRSGLDKARPPSWTALNRWEYSHVARAVLAMASLMALVIAISGE